MYFRDYRLSKTWLDHSLESPVSVPPSIINVLMGAKHLWNLYEGTFIIFLMKLKGNDLQNISFIGILNLRGVCYHIDSR